MPLNQWARAKEIFSEAAELPFDERPGFVSRACNGSLDLQAFVERLLAQSTSTEALGIFTSTEFRDWPPGPGATMVGRSLSHYQILAKLGEGGMGAVYRAADTHLMRDVAIKVLSASHASDPAVRVRFINEARAASALSHPNIITVHDISSHDGMDFIVMEHLQGKTLAEMLPAQKGFPLGDVLKYAVQIAGALAEAHAAQILHRDLKPANIMVSSTGVVKVLDFGLAKFTGETGPISDAHTEEGAVLGTVAYMSPEQAQGGKLDVRSDIFSFGAVLYEMLTGRRAFNQQGAISVLAAILHTEPPPIGELAPQVPPELQHIVLRCLRKDPRRRFQTAVELKAALEDLHESLAIAPPVHGHPGETRGPARLRRMLPVLAVAAAAVLAIGGWYYWRPASHITALESIPIATEPGDKGEASFSPDGTQIAFRWDGEKHDNHDIYVRLIGTATALRLTTDPGVDSQPAWSPNGRWIAFVRDQSDHPGAAIILIPALGGQERRLTNAWARESSLSWSPDSQWLYLKHQADERGPESIYVLSVESGEMRQLTNPPKRGDRNPVVSPDGKTLAFIRHSLSSSGDVYLQDLKNGSEAVGEPRRISSTGLVSSRPAWTPDGKALIVTNGVVGTLRLSRLRADGRSQPERLLGDEFNFDPVVSYSRQRLGFTKLNYDTNIWLVNPAARRAGLAHPSEFISSTRLDFNPNFSPDGRRLVFSSNRTGAFELWRANRDGSGLQQLTSFNGPQVGAPRWSPAGDTIAFDCVLEGQSRICSISPEGGKPRILPHLGVGAVPIWSRDGQSLYFASNRSGRSEVWKARLSGGNPVQVTTRGGFLAQESPDGRTLYYARTDGPVQIFRIPLEAGGSEKEAVAIQDRVDYRAWAVTARGIWYISIEPDKRRQLKFLNFTGGAITVVAEIDKPLRWGLAVSPDESQILYAQVDLYGKDLMLVEGVW